MRIRSIRFIYYLISIFCFVTSVHAQSIAPSTPDATATLSAIQVLEAEQSELLKKEQELLKSIGEPLPLPALTPEATPTILVKETIAKGKNKKKEVTLPSPSPSPTPTAEVASSSPERIEATPTPSPTATSTPDKLKEAETTITRLRKELDQTRSRLALSETEVERLALLIDDRQKLQPRRTTQKNPPQFNQGLRVREPSEIQAKVDGDMQIATVISEKAQLRTGPGMNNSPLMTVAQGTRLAVETRNGDWFRVIAPSGARAWVYADVLDIGGKRRATSAVPTDQTDNGFPTDEEAAAFKALQLGSSK